MKEKKNTKKPEKLQVKIVERKLGREKAWGQCFQGDNYIEIDPRQEAKCYLDTIIHEMLHLLYPEWSEEQVIETATSLAEAVWASNYRKIAP